MEQISKDKDLIKKALMDRSIYADIKAETLMLGSMKIFSLNITLEKIEHQEAINFLIENGWRVVRRYKGYKENDKKKYISMVDLKLTY